MTTGQETNPEPVQLPVAPSSVRTVALSELERLNTFVQSIALEDWSKPSAVKGWTVGDVVAHLNLALGLYGRLLSTVTAGNGAGTLWKAFGQVTKSMAPVAGPAFHAINSAIPRVIDRALAPEVIKAQLAASSRTVREKVERIGSDDYTRPVYYMGAPWPLTFFLTAMVNEFAIHGWDIESSLQLEAHLSEGARAILPWFYWSGTPLMLRPSGSPNGRVQVSLQDPPARMWWDMAVTRTDQGAGEMENPDVTITGASGTFLLVLSGRIKPEDAFRTTSLEAVGNEALAKSFLKGWKVV
jgi:uncharacterized protein (TIGR03083 family)